MIIAQITDCHVSTPDTYLSTHYRTHEHLARAVAHIEALNPRPDHVLVTGDLVDAGSVEEYERLRHLLAPLTVPVHLMVGNHDSRAELRAVFGDHAYLPADGFVQYALDLGPLRLIALDTLIDGAPGGRLCGERLAWLADRLAEAPATPTVVAMHHPPFRTGINKMDSMGLEGSDGLADLIRRYDNVERIVCGHIHRPIVRRFAGTVVSVCPGTAHQIDLDLRDGQALATVMEPPCVHMHVFLDGEGLVSHASYVGDHGAPFEIYDVAGKKLV
jgi:3',5'-cyclic AMP phosphodiesterase CpdA